MALYTVTTGKVTLTASATKSLILLDPVTVSDRLRKVVISMDASTAMTAVAFDVYRVVTLGSAAGTSTTPVLCDERDAAATSTALTVLTTEPTTVTVIDTIALQPLGGVYPDWQPFGAEGVVTKAGGARVGLRYTTAASVTPDCWATFYFEE